MANNERKLCQMIIAIRVVLIVTVSLIIFLNRDRIDRSGEGLSSILLILSIFAPDLVLLLLIILIIANHQPPKSKAVDAGSKINLNFSSDTSDNFMGELGNFSDTSVSNTNSLVNNKLLLTSTPEF